MCVQFFINYIKDRHISPSNHLQHKLVNFFGFNPEVNYQNKFQCHQKKIYTGHSMIPTEVTFIVKYNESNFR